MRRIKQLPLVSFAALAVALGLTLSQRSMVTVAAAVDPHAGHARMSAAEHIAAMAAAGNIHAGHAMDEARWSAAGLQAAAVPSNPNLPADNEGAAARLAASPRKGEFGAQGANNGANLRASQDAWPRTVAWIKKYTSSAL